MHSRSKGIHIPHRKNTANAKPVKMPAPSRVTIPMNMSIGKPSVPCVKVGDEVKVGQVIATAGGFVGADIHASVSGKVAAVAPVWTSNGGQTSAITIESDGLMSLSETCVPPTVSDFDSFIDAVRKSGVVGLGGAGFPTAVKLSVNDVSKIETLVLNGAECEPYITSDTFTMTNKAEFIKEGIELLKKYLAVKSIVIGIENNKPNAIKKLKELESDPAVSVKVLHSSYPQGAEKVLIYNCTGKIVPEGKLPIDVGVIVMNVTTLAFIAEYMHTGIPLVEKTITVDGSAVANPQLVTVPIGTDITEVFEFCGGFKKTPRKMLYGGPMMGIALKDPHSPILKNTNAIIALDKKDATLPVSTACIKCGRCVRACPLSLMPLDFARGFAMRDFELLEKRRINICMECGCCSYVCPAHRPLVENHRLAKQALRKHLEEKKGEKE